MSMELNETHDPNARSFVESANFSGCDFPIQNLPFGAFTNGDDAYATLCVAIGDQVLNLHAAAERSLLDGIDESTCEALQDGTCCAALSSGCSAQIRRIKKKPPRACWRSAM
jgi:fumarylacetoacetase